MLAADPVARGREAGFWTPGQKKKTFLLAFFHPFCLLFHHYHHHRPIIQFCVLCRFKCWAPECSAVGLTYCCRVTSTTIFNVAFLPLSPPHLTLGASKEPPSYTFVGDEGAMTVMLRLGMELFYPLSFSALPTHFFSFSSFRGPIISQ